MFSKELVLIILFIILTCILQKINLLKKKIENFTNLSSNKLIKNVKDEEKKLICFSLWGKNECYNWGALENALLAKKIYPGWICRFYIGKNVIPDVVKYLQKLDNVELIFMNDNKAMTNMFWRFEPIFIGKCKMYLSRDTDSRLNIREKVAVDIWEKTNKDILIIRDHRAHNYRILGGMFGVKNNALLKFKDDFKNRYSSSNMKYGDDQEFLKTVVYPKIKNNSLIFDKNHHFKDEKVLQIPENEYPVCIGQVDCVNYNEIHKAYGINISSSKRIRDHSNDKNII